LIPPEPSGKLYQILHQQATSDFPTLPFLEDSHSFWSETEESSTRESDLRRKRNWRISADQVTLLRESIKKFEGTHNFHNFTVGRDFSDRSNQRHMKKIEVTIIFWTVQLLFHDHFRRFPTPLSTGIQNG
jgi:tRNA pseudouridine38-40 synthase